MSVSYGFGDLLTLPLSGSLLRVILLSLVPDFGLMVVIHEFYTVEVPPSPVKQTLESLT